MEVLLFLKHAIITILIGYLGFTNMLAEHASSLLGVESTEEYREESVEKIPDTHEPSPELTALSKMFALNTAIPRVLRDNHTFQEAALIANEGTLIESEVRHLSKDEIEASLVNILCQYKTEDYIRTTTGTGFFIEETGVILTNAHVAQFLLLKEVDQTITHTECIIRSGNPAEPRYMADLLYISPTWILENAKLISSEEPRGTGEYDYALLYITKAIGDTALPDAFPALPLHSNLLSHDMDGKSVIAGGYPALKLQRDGARAKLYPAVDTTTIEELYTFGSNYADIFSVGESKVGEHGASGGPITDPEKGVIGLIVTKGDEATDGEQSLRALTLSYIDRSITEETGYSLAQNARGNLALRSDVFKGALAPFLAHLLEIEL